MWASSITSKQIGLSCKKRNTNVLKCRYFTSIITQQCFGASCFPSDIKAEPDNVHVCKGTKAYHTKSLSLLLNEFTIPSWIGGWGRLRRRLPGLSPADVDMCVLQYLKQVRLRRRIDSTSLPTSLNFYDAEACLLFPKTVEKMSYQHKYIVSTDLSSRNCKYFF
jgi:hypothetical protein